MSYAQRLAAITVTTAADGSATAFSEVCTGTLSSVRYVKTNFADGSTFTITSEATGETLWTETGVNASATRAPRQATHGTAGTAALYVAAGTAVLDKIALAVDRVKIVIANGGNVTSGVFHIVME